MTYDELKAKYGKNWGIEDPAEINKTVVPAPTIDQLREHYKRFDLAFKSKLGASRDCITATSEETTV